MDYWIVRPTCCEWLTPPLVPVMVNVNAPVGALRFALMVSVDEPDVSDAGLKLALVRRGSPATVRLTAPEKPEPGVTVMVYPVEEPRAMVALVGVTAREKSALTTSVTLAV